MPKRSRLFPGGQEEVLQRFPRLVAHLICESLGYFTPLSAANALLHYRENQPFWCEWYIHIAGLRSANGGRRAGKADLGRRHRGGWTRRSAVRRATAPSAPRLHG